MFIGDEYVVFAFYTAMLVLGTLLLERMARRLWDRVPLWTLALAVVYLRVRDTHASFPGPTRPSTARRS